MKITSFTDLNAWREGHKVVLLIYKTTKNFPQDEKYALATQMKRSSVSITSNIAEGFSRKGKKEKAQFLYMALGSTTELHNQIIVAKDVGYIDEKRYNELLSNLQDVHKLINGLINSSYLRST